MSETSMKIISLEAENFKKIKAIRIKPDGSTVLLTGKNGAGKSSVLDAIMAAFCGAKNIPDAPIRTGEEDAMVRVETENFIITRSFTPGNTYLKVENAEGVAAKSPQALLDKIVGDIAFDPTKFIDYDPKKQRMILMELAGLDFADIDSKIDAVKAKRSDAKRDKERFEHEAERIVKAEDVPAEEVSMAELSEKMQTALNLNAEQDKILAEIDQNKHNVELLGQSITDSDSLIEKLKKQIETETLNRNTNAKRQDELLSANVRATELLKEKIDIESIQAEIKGVEDTNFKVRSNARRKELSKEALKMASEFSKLGTEMKRLELDKAKLLAEVKMPVEGLSVNSDGVIYGDIPLSQVNSAKQLEIGVAVSMALNPTLKVIRMNGNDLDEESLKAISKIVDDAGYQVWIEKVDDTGNMGIVIEDGEIKTHS